jgi:hypothetical protein
MHLVAGFCFSAASTARFVEDDARAVGWFRRAANLYRSLQMNQEAYNALTSAEALLQPWVNTLLRANNFAAAVPLLIDLAEVSREMGKPESQATALYNASIGVVQTSQDFAAARELAEAAAELFEATSTDAATARKLVAFCDARMNTADG